MVHTESEFYLSIQKIYRDMKPGKILGWGNTEVVKLFFLAGLENENQSQASSL